MGTKVSTTDCLVTYLSEDGQSGKAVSDGIWFSFRTTKEIAEMLKSVERSKGDFFFEVRGKDDKGNLISDITAAKNIRNAPRKS